MGICTVCKKTYNKLLDADDKTVNYFTWAGKEWLICRYCIKKVLLSMAAQLLSDKQDIRQKTVEEMQKLANDPIISFVGTSEEYAKLSVRHP